MAILDLAILSQGAIGWIVHHDPVTLLNDQLHHFTPILAQRIEDPDVLGKMQRSFENFIKSGQVWALGIGFVLGYMFRNFTAY